MPYQQHPHPHYYPQQPMHPSHVPPQPGPSPLPGTHQGPPQQQQPPPQHQQHMMPTGPPPPQQPHHHQPGGGYYQHPGYGHPPPPPHGPPPQQAMPPPPGPYMQYNHYYPHQPPPPPPPMQHGPPVPHPHGPPTQQAPPPTHGPQHQQHMLPQGPPPQQTHHHPGYAYHHPSMQPSYPQPPHPHPQQTMPHGSPYGQYNHYYQPPIAPMQPMQPMQHGPPVPHPHGPPNQPPPPHHQSQIMPPGPQQPHQTHHYYPHPPMPHPAYHQPIQHQQQPPPPQPPPHPQAQPHPNLTPQPTHPILPPQSPHLPTSRAQTPQLGSQTPTKSMQHPSSTPASSPSIVAKVEKKEITFPKNSVEATKLAATKRRKYTSKDVTDVEVWRLLMCLKSGLLAESSWAIDVLSILLNDDSTSMYFSLSNMPGFLEAILDHLKCSLGEIFKDMAIKDTALKAELSRPVNYSHWQEGNGEDMSYIQVYTEPHNNMETIRRCICISTVLRNLSFTPGNDVEMSKHAGLLLILGKILMYKLEDDDKEVSTDPTPNEWLLNSLREDALVLISNLSSSLDLSQMTDRITFAILNSLLYWAVSDDAYALDPFPFPSMVSPQRLALEALAKLSIVEANVDLILATPPWSRIEQLFEILTNKLQMNEDQPIREFSLVLLSNLVAADSGIARKVAQGNAISRLVSFLETSLMDPEKYATTQDMLRRAALTLRYMSSIADCRTVFTPKHQQRLLNLVMSQDSAFDSEVNQAIASIIFDLSV